MVTFLRNDLVLGTPHINKPSCLHLNILLAIGLLAGDFKGVYLLLMIYNEALEQ